MGLTENLKGKLKSYIFFLVVGVKYLMYTHHKKDHPIQYISRPWKQ